MIRSAFKTATRLFFNASSEPRDGSYGDSSADHELFCSVAEIEAAVVAAGGDHPSVPESIMCSSAASIIQYALDSLKKACVHTRADAA